ncbi:hypothetical protein IQ238_19315 [Pleurocapsales cyanobacterium LEGE 06147]|nr:hypothetical protein [Pleurocapsales cyanobacterium LEGE 06147]
MLTFSKRSKLHTKIDPKAMPSPESHRIIELTAIRLLIQTEAIALVVCQPKNDE